MKTLTTFALVCSLSSTAFSQAIHHVDASAAPGGNGQSWAQAFGSLDHGLDAAHDGDQIWVAAGTYKPRHRTSASDPRSVSFRPRDGVHMFGGFAGNEQTLAGRAGLFADTILDGEIGNPNTIQDNARHVLRLDGNGFLHTFDGFCVQNGYADGTGLHGTGGAAFVQLGTKFVRNCIFRDNRAVRGGALYVEASVCFVQDCLFEGNLAQRGGALFATQRIAVANTIFRRNAAFVTGGAILVTQGGTPSSTFQNCLLYGNRARTGGAVFLTNGSVTNTPGKALFSGCTVVSNFAAIHGGAFATPPNALQGCDLRVWNSIVWNNQAVENPHYTGHGSHLEVLYSDFQGGWPGAGNIDSNPRFTNALNHDYTLRFLSPCIDSASNLRVSPDAWDLDQDGVWAEATPFDLLGQPRHADDSTTPDTGEGNSPITDMGAVEVPGSD